MTISGNIKRKKAIVLSPQKVRDINRIVLQNCDRIEYAAVTAAKTRISFEDIDELLDYDNFKPRRITELEITGYSGYSRMITIEISEWSLFSVANYGTTIRCDYKLSSVDAETLFLHDFDEWYRKCIADYWLLGKFSISGLVCIPGAFVWILWLLFGRPALNIDYGDLTIVSILSAVVIACFLFAKMLKRIDTYFFGNLFPAITFLWGEEEQRYEKWGKFRSNLFWGIVMAIIIGLFTSFLYDALKGL